MKIWKVGGAVRDGLLGRADSDIDWVVTGSTPEAMRAAGYLPVGRDFPVFLHPVTKHEYALARTERKSAPGYHGFVFHTDPGVTLEDDLRRRDLTINAMAQDDDGTLIDPYGGRRDLDARVLRHVSPAFAEDPVRILRVARFAARFTDFTVAPETLALMRAMVVAGEVDALVAERVWQEVSRGLMEARPSRLIEVLDACGALSRLLPELGAVDAGDEFNSLLRAERLGSVCAALDRAAQRAGALPVRFAVLTHRVGSSTPAAHGSSDARPAAVALAALRGLCERWRVPLDCREVAEAVLRERETVVRSAALDAAALVGLLDRGDAWRRPARFEQLIAAVDCIDGQLVASTRSSLLGLRQAWRRAAEVDAGAVAQRAAARGLRGPAIGEAVQAARILAVSEADDEPND